MIDVAGFELSVYAFLWAIAATLFWALVLYLVIRFGVAHGMRGHTRWVDAGKDDYR